jgi:protein-S-isoprenylcysteine O-methyltransferase Ste14
VPFFKITLQLLQLVVAVAALILWPASLYRAGLYNGKVWLLFWTYMFFFGGGSVWRLLTFGPLASRKKDQQAKSLGTRAAWLSFVVCMPLLHWGAVGSYMKGRAKAFATAAAGGNGADWGAYAPGPGASSVTLYDVIGLGLLGGAVWLNWQAARHLGKAYDRVVQPEALVTTGPYAWVQHPIYTSYIMLFCGYAMTLHSLGYALLALVVCLGYYRSRVALEAGVLQGAFGDTYKQYQQKTKLFVPFLL